MMTWVVCVGLGSWLYVGMYELVGPCFDRYYL